MTRSRDAMLVVIGVFKLTKGTLVVALALGLLRLGQDGLAGALARWATRLHIDPDGRHFARAVRAMAALDSQQLNVVSTALCDEAEAEVRLVNAAGRSSAGPAAVRRGR